MAKLCNVTFYSAAAYVSQRAKKTDDVGECLKLVIRSKHIVLTALAFLNLARTDVIYYETKDSPVHRRGVALHNSVKLPLSFITFVSEALFSNVNRLELFEILMGHVFGASESRITFRRSREIDWS